MNKFAMDDEGSDLEEQVNKDDPKDPYAPRVLKIKKGERGFGFNVRGQVSEGGQLRSINGVLYPPLQMISAVLENGPAANAGIRVGDRILIVNNVNCEGADHRTVVDLIKQGEDELTMVLISVTPSEARKLDGPTVIGARDYIDYSEQKSAPLTIPDFSYKEDNGEKYVAYNIYVSETFTCSRRYKEFFSLHSELKRKFPDFPFPKFPNKWPFALSETQLDARRRNLESYMVEVGSVRVIAETSTMEDFLKSDQHEESAAKKDQADSEFCEININLPDKSTVPITIKKQYNTPKVYEAAVRSAGLADISATFFALFEITESGFYRKIDQSEYPHNIYIKHYTQTGEGRIVLRKWIFTPTRELDMNSDVTAVKLLYEQTIADIRCLLIKPGILLEELKSYKTSNNKQKFLELSRTLEGYCEISFPHCLCDARKEGHVIAGLSIDNLSLDACTKEGVLEDQKHTFNWSEIKSWQINIDEECFSFEYQKLGKKPRTVKIYSEFYVYMNECANRIVTEINWFKRSSSNEDVQT